MQEKKKMIWAGFDVGKETFSASLDQVTENGKAKITSLPCRDFKRTPEGLTKFFQWAAGFVSGKDLHIVMETTGWHMSCNTLSIQTVSGCRSVSL